MRRILLLSSAYEPITFINERRALSLVLRNVVDLIAFWDGDVLMPRHGKDNRVIQMPATVRLNKWVNRKSRMPTFRRYVVFARDDYKCQYCNKELTSREATIDHVVPKSQGGSTTWKNCVTSCRPCNRYKNNFTPEKAGMTLHKKPTMPTLAHFWDVRATDENWHPDWNNFIPK